MSWWWKSSNQQQPTPGSAASATTSAIHDVPSNPDQPSIRQHQNEPLARESDSSDDNEPTGPDPRLETRAKSRTGYSIATLPETMSCRQAFDEAMYCSFLGSHFNNVYRYGELRECSEKWSDFWFCARIRSYPEIDKKHMVRERYRAKDEKYMTGPSSEDVWSARTKPVETAFDLDPDAAGLFEKRKGS